MSSQAMGWAIKCLIKKSSLKNMFMVCADLANTETGEVFASLQYYRDVSGLSKPTVLACLEEMVTMGVLERTEERRGSTRQIPVYIFHEVPTIPRLERRKSSQKQRGQKSDHLKEVNFLSERGQVFDDKEVKKLTTEPIRGNLEEGTFSNHSDGGDSDKDLFGDPIVTAEQKIAIMKADMIATVRNGWNELSAEVPGVKPLRGGKLDDARAETAWTRAQAFAGVLEGEQPADIWAEIFRQILKSHWLCGETRPRDGRPPFGLQLTWLLEHRNFTKVLEGKFADERDPTIPGRDQSRRSPAGEALSIVLERRRASGNRSPDRGSQGGARAG